MASKVVKTTTGLTGLAVAQNPRHTLGMLYGKIVRVLQKMPDTSAYKKHTEQIVTERACILRDTEDIVKVEEKINCGQVEELIVQAENELIMARKMLGWKPWEPLVREAPKNQWVWPPPKC